MRISAEPLPSGCKLLRLHPGEGVEYIAHTIIKPINATECVKEGYDYCYIHRKKGTLAVTTRFNLNRFK